MNDKKVTVPLFARIAPEADEKIRADAARERRSLGEQLNMVILSIPDGSDPKNPHYVDTPVDIITTKTVIATGREINHEPAHMPVDVFPAQPVEEKEG